MSGNAELLNVLSSLPRNNQETGDAEIARFDVAIRMAAMAGSMVALPRSKPARRTNVEKELESYGKLCRNLGLHIKGMSRTSIGLIEQNQGDAPHPLMLFDTLKKALESSRRAFTHMPEDLPDEPIMGRSKKKREEFVTDQAAFAYEQITGLPPTTVTKDGKAGGAFVEFLSDVFEALGFENASAELQARAWTKRQRKKSI